MHGVSPGGAIACILICENNREGDIVGWRRKVNEIYVKFIIPFYEIWKSSPR